MNKFQKEVRQDMIPYIEHLMAQEREFLSKVSAKRSWFQRTDDIQDIVNQSKTWIALYETRLQQFKDYLKR